jgi:hypothetical protein
VQGAAAGAAWKSVMQKRLFAEPHAAGSATLAHLSAIFATRNADIWKAPDVLAWLLCCADAAASASDAAAAGAPAEAAARLHESQVSSADARALAEVSYPESADNEYSHLETASFSDARPTLPPEQIAAMQGHGGARGGPEEMGAAELHALLQQLANGPEGAGRRDGGGEACTFLLQIAAVRGTCILAATDGHVQHGILD